MPSLWFLVPAHGREDVARVCLRQLRRTCDTLAEHGIPASAAVAACDGNLDTAAELGFGTVDRDNDFLGRRWNDLYELAARAGVDYVMPMGSDDWIDWQWVVSAGWPGEREIRSMRLFAMVSEDGTRIARLRVGYDGGLGIRIVPVALLRELRFRPCVEDRRRAIDATTLMRIRRNVPDVRVSYHDLHGLQVVDWKSSGVQLNSYESCSGFRREESADPFGVLAGVFPEAALTEMRQVIGERMGVAA